MQSLAPGRTVAEVVASYVAAQDDLEALNTRRMDAATGLPCGDPYFVEANATS